MLLITQITKSWLKSNFEQGGVVAEIRKPQDAPKSGFVTICANDSLDLLLYRLRNMYSVLKAVMGSAPFPRMKTPHEHIPVMIKFMKPVSGCFKWRAGELLLFHLIIPTIRSLLLASTMTLFNQPNMQYSCTPLKM